MRTCQPRALSPSAVRVRREINDRIMRPANVFASLREVAKARIDVPHISVERRVEGADTLVTHGVGGPAGV